MAASPCARSVGDPTQRPRKTDMNRALLIAGLAVLALAGAITYAANHAFSSTKSDSATVSGWVRRVGVAVAGGAVKLVGGGDGVRGARTSRYVMRAPKVTQRVRDGVLTLRGNC